MRILFALWLVTCPLCSQFETKLAPETAKAFEDHVQTVETELQNRWSGRAPFFSLASSPDDQRRLLKGELLVRPAVSGNPLEIPDGLIHDWVGAIYMPNTSVSKVLAVLQDFDHHAQIYPEIIRSHVVKRQENEITGYWRVERKQQFVPAVFDIQQDAYYKAVAPGRWICRAYANDIREVQDAGTKKEQDYPPGQGLGLLWRLNAFWSIEARGNGVLAECRTVSLSRSIPSGMGWMIKPFIQNVPRESLTSTLANTRKAIARQ